MARCVASGIAHRGGLARHGHQRLYALAGDQVVRLGHPDDVLAAAGGPKADLEVLVVAADQPAPLPEHFAAPLPGVQHPSVTSYEQARSSHAFPVPAAAANGLKAFVAGAGQKVGEQPASMEQVEVETARWLTLAGQVGLMDLKTTVAEFTPAGGPAATGAAWMRTLVERRLQAEGRLDGPRRLVEAPSAKVPEDRLAGELLALQPVAGGRPARRLRMLPPSRPSGGDAVSHFELRFAERVSGVVGDRQQLDAAAGDTVGELADSIEQRDVELGDAVAKALPMVNELLTNPLHDVRFAYDATETTRTQLAQLQTSGEMFRRTTLVVDDPAGVPGRKLAVVVSVEPAPRGTSAQDRQAAWVRPITCFHYDTVDGAGTGPSMPLRDELRLGGYAGGVQASGKAMYGSDTSVETRLQQALHEVAVRRRRQLAAA